MSHDQVRKFTETAILVALAVVLDILFKLVPFFNMPQGGHISLAMLPVLLIGFRNGWKYGLAGGFCYAVINFFVDGMTLHIGSIFFDYIFAFTVLGCTGFFQKQGKNVIKFNLIIFGLCFARYLFHSLSGVIFFKEYAALPESWHVTGNALYFVYSFIYYNLPYMGISTVICMVVGTILHVRGLIYKGIPE
ncbi:MAG: energy-coupled thiamine transporter ThiT [Bacilli bacterium]|nr:energy-coupled thiamine transporter ThiT [Acholeplasmataceae bacterium]MDY2902259.1 energy-coupled thiamine transporter ThiT [Bacilli bacterium]